MASIHALLDTETRMNHFIEVKSKPVAPCPRTVIKHRNKRLSDNSAKYILLCRGLNKLKGFRFYGLQGQHIFKHMTLQSCQ